MAQSLSGLQRSDGLCQAGALRQQLQQLQVEHIDLLTQFSNSFFHGIAPTVPAIHELQAGTLRPTITCSAPDSKWEAAQPWVPVPGTASAREGFLHGSVDGRGSAWLDRLFGFHGCRWGSGCGPLSFSCRSRGVGGFGQFFLELAAHLVESPPELTQRLRQTARHLGQFLRAEEQQYQNRDDQQFPEPDRTYLHACIVQG